MAASFQPNGCSGFGVQSQPATSLSAQILPTYQMPTSQIIPIHQPPSYESLSAVSGPPAYEPVPTLLTHLVTSSTGALLPAMQSRQLSLATSAAIFVPDVVFVSADGTAVTQSVTSNTASLPQLQCELQPQFNSVTSNTASLPRPPFEVQPQFYSVNNNAASLPQPPFSSASQFQPDVTSQLAAELSAFTSGWYHFVLCLSVGRLFHAFRPAMANRRSPNRSHDDRSMRSSHVV